MQVGLEEIELKPKEYAFLVDDTPFNAKQFPLWLPKLMPLLPKTGKKETTVVINNNIFVNETKPTPANSVKTQNFLMIDRLPNADFEYKIKLTAGDNKMKKGTKLVTTILNSNIRNIFVGDDI